MTVTIERYQFKELLGQGAMAEVYRAYDTHMHRDVAIKLLRQDRCVDAYFRSRLIREAQAVAQIPHENIVKVFDAGEAEGRPYIVMEVLEGQFLDDWLRSHEACPWEDTLKVARQLAAGLSTAHAKGIIHRDIKPANIIWQEDKQVAKLADFGIAHIETAQTAYTQAGQLIGTPQYMAPEQIQGKQADGRSDLFSLGVVLYHLLTGRRPFTGETLASLAYQITQAEPDPIEKLAPKVPKGFVRIINRLMAKAPKQRYQSADELLADLKALQAGGPAHGPSRTGLWASVAVATIAVVAVGTWWFWPSPPQTTTQPRQTTAQPGDDGKFSVAKRESLQRDIVSRLKLECARINVTISPEGVATLRGHIAKDEDMTRVWDVMDNTPDVINTIYEVETLPWPHCQAASIIGPYKAHNSSSDSGLKVQANSKLAKDEPLVLDLTTPDYESYIYIDYYSPDGNVMHLYAPTTRSKMAPASTQMVFGQKQHWQVPVKSGKNLIVVMATAKPLLKEKRERSEQAQTYLAFLHRSLSEQQTRIAADYITLTTGQSL